VKFDEPLKIVCPSCMVCFLVVCVYIIVHKLCNLVCFERPCTCVAVYFALSVLLMIVSVSVNCLSAIVDYYCCELLISLLLLYNFSFASLLCKLFTADDCIVVSFIVIDCLVFCAVITDKVFIHYV